MKTMKKYVRILLVAMMSLMVLALAGCGEEDKYNQAKTEVTTMMEEARNVNDKKDSPYYSDSKEETLSLIKEHGKERVELLKGELTKREAIYKQIDEKLKDMAGYAKGNGKLEADLTELRHKVDSDKAGVLQMSKEVIAAEKMRIQIYGAK